MCRAAVLALLGVLLVSGAAWAQPPGAVVAEGTQDGRARLVVSGDGPITVAVDGQPQPTTATPLVSERTALALVVDASADGGPGLHPGLGGLVDFALGLPPTTRTALVADTTPPAVVTQTRADPTGVLTGLSGITAGGGRQTVAALELAVAQLPREPDGPRLVVLYTGGASTADAPDALAARLRADGVVLAVVTTADDGYWRAVADGTGGVAVGAAPSGVVDAFGRVA
ncbi:MAG TPA: VWA domain-containing protein, partial [Pseudonocardia sp.]|nr:VWA domain-containing protein [Pseudonocardia sp.]